MPLLNASNTQTQGESEMTVILALCIIAAWPISRPIVHALGV
jgi:hypothetical protein